MSLIKLGAVICGGVILFSVILAASSTEAPAPIVSVTPEPVQVAEIAEAQDSVLYVVTEVVDGDTIKIKMNDAVETLRLVGLDTPETVDPRKPVQCFGKEASNKGKELLLGRKVKIEMDPTQGERDKYGRLLAYVYRDDGMFYNKFMISEGYAYEYTYNTPYKFQSEFKEAQKEAERLQKGLWAPDVCEVSEPVAPAPSTPIQNATPIPSKSEPISTGDKDCKDFRTQAEAQAYFNSKGGSSTNNVDRLDGSDKDGKVCESLP